MVLLRKKIILKLHKSKNSKLWSKDRMIWIYKGLIEGGLVLLKVEPIWIFKILVNWIRIQVLQRELLWQIMGLQSPSINWEIKWDFFTKLKVFFKFINCSMKVIKTACSTTLWLRCSVKSFHFPIQRTSLCSHLALVQIKIEKLLYQVNMFKIC